MTFGERLKELRLKNSYAQHEFANKMHVSRTCVSSWETERTQPNMAQIYEMSRLFDVSVDYLVYGKEPDEQVSKENIDAKYIIEKLPSMDIEAIETINRLTTYLLKLNEKK